MDLHRIVNAIEEMDDTADRCIAYSEVILYLQQLKETVRFVGTGVPWKDDINNMIIDNLQQSINENIIDIRKFIEFNVKH